VRAAALSEAPVAEPAVADERLVTLGGAVTEIVFALGFGERVVAVDATSGWPPAAEALPKVGYYRAVSAEGLLAQQPTRVIADAQAGPPATLEALTTAGVPLTLVPDAMTVEGTQARIRAVGEALGVPEEAGRLADEVARAVASARGAIPAGHSTPAVLFVYSRGARTQLVAGRNTAADAMITLAGGRNAVTAFEGFRPLTAEAVATSAADVVLMPEHSLEEMGGLPALLQLPGMAQLPAVQQGHVITLDDGLLLSFGPRLGEAVGLLVEALHPWRVAPADMPVAGAP
jgi:iron complex transport system substrate-binding protein